MSTAYLIGTLFSGFLLPYGGRCFDRFGSRLTMMICSVVFGLVLMLMSQCANISGWLNGGVPSVMSSMVIMAIGFFLIRFLGQGMLTTVSRGMLGKWFHRRRGFAVALSGIGVSIGFSVAPPSFYWLITQYGWEGAYIILGAANLIIMSSFAWLFFRDNPEECGLGMDGPGYVPRRQEHEDQRIVKDMTRDEALNTYTFWAFNFGLAFFGLYTTAFTFDVVAIGAEMELAEEEAFLIFMPMAVFTVMSNLLAAWMVDRTRIKYVLTLMCVGLGTGALGFYLMPSWLGYAMIIGGMALGGGCFQTLSPVVWPRFYGRKHVGAISGVNMASIVIASALGPFLFNYSKDLTGSFDLAFAVSAVFAFAIAASAYKAENPQRHF